MSLLICYLISFNLIFKSEVRVIGLKFSSFHCTWMTQLVSSGSHDESNVL